MSMRPDVEKYLREQGWKFAGVSQPDHKRLWCQTRVDAQGRELPTRIEGEEYLVELALNILQ